MNQLNLYFECCEEWKSDRISLNIGVVTAQRNSGPHKNFDFAGEEEPKYGFIGTWDDPASIRSFGRNKSGFYLENLSEFRSRSEESCSTVKQISGYEIFKFLQVQICNETKRTNWACISL